jgi:hypothetical protein
VRGQGPAHFNFKVLKTLFGIGLLVLGQKKISISGPMLQQEAKEVADKLRKTDFKASNGWLKSFRKRHCIVFSTVCGESVDVCEETVAERREKLCALMEVMNQRT